MLTRERYLKRIRPWYDTEDIKIISGVRRSGKSTLLRQILDEIQRNGANNIQFYDFEAFENEMYYNDPAAFHSQVVSKLSPTDKNYIFIDEVQYMDRFERVLASIKGKGNVSLFATGSNSRLLKGALATHLTGRAVEFQIMPFSFSEVIEYHDITDAESLWKEFDTFIRWGGFPRVQEIREPEQKRQILESLYVMIKGKDIFNTHRVNSPRLFDSVATYVLSQSGSIISSENITAALRTNNKTVERSTVYSYLDYLEEAYLVNKLERYSISGKSVLSTRPKYYAVDPGFLSVQQGNENINLALNLETVVLQELLSRGYSVYSGKTYKGEIDFVVLKEGHPVYIQTDYLLASQEIIDREFGAFSSIRDNWPKLVISLDRFDFSRDGIIHMNIIDFLLGKQGCPV